MKREIKLLEKWVARLPNGMTKRPKYFRGIGVFKGTRSTTVWIKLTYPGGSTKELKLGNLSSYTWEEIIEKRDALQREVERGGEIKEIPTFKQHGDDWLERAKVRLRGWKTSYMHLNTHIYKELGNKPVTHITVQDVDKYINKRLKRAKPATVKRELDTINQVINDAIRYNYLSDNPVKQAQKIKGVVGRQRFLNAEEITVLLNAAHDTADWLPDFILWCLHSGMRRGEVLRLKWDDVYVIGNGTQVVHVPFSKSDKSRTIVCTDTMKEILERQMKRKKGDKVFPVPFMTLKRKWKKAKEASKLDVTLHDLRRTHATLAIMAGVDIKTLADRLGHSDLSMLERHYAALVGSAVQESVVKIETALNRGSQEPQD